jgi:AraC-like DNA-binding protein
MYKSVPTDLKKIKLNTDLFRLHKSGTDQSDFGMDNTAELLEGCFGLYSTTNVRKNIGPIKTDYFRISLTRQGSAQFDIGLVKYLPYRNYILFGIPGQIFSLHDFSSDFLAYYMLFNEPFMPGASLNKKQEFPFLTWSGLQCFELENETADEIENIIFKMNGEIKRSRSQCSDMIRLYIQQILILSNRSYSLHVLRSSRTLNTIQNLFNKYIKLVGQHFLSVRKVNEYAAMLHVSPDHLNRAIRSCSDRTAREFIEEMILMEAKAYLLHSSYTISEIAYQLDFSDPSHFNRFFKNLSGQTPLDYRKQSQMFHS